MTNKKLIKKYEFIKKKVFNKITKNKQNIYFYSLKQSKNFFKFYKYSGLIGHLIKRGLRLKSLFIFINMLKTIKMILIKTQKFNNLGNFILFCECLKKVNPYLKHKVFYRAGKKYIIPQLTNKFQLISKTFHNIQKFVKETQNKMSLTQQLSNEIIDILNSQGKSYNFIYKEWYTFMQDGRKLLYLFDRKKKKNVYTYKNNKIKRINRKKKKWFNRQLNILLYKPTKKKKKKFFGKSLLISLC